MMEEKHLSKGQSSENLPNNKRRIQAYPQTGSANCTSMMTWDMDPVRKSYVYADLEVEDIEWHDDEHTPSESICKSFHSHSNSKRKKSEENCDPKEKKVSSVKPTNTFVNTVIRQKNSFDDFSFLSDEIILRIFSFLNRKSLGRCVRVCKNWKRLGYDDSLWGEIDLTRSTLTCDGALGAILHRGAVHLRLSRTNILGSICCESCPDIGLQKMRNSRRKVCELFSLKSLDASMCKFEKCGILSLLKKCRCLKSLSLHGTALSLEEMRAITNNQLLEELNLSMCSGMKAAGIRLLSKKCIRLRSLNMAWTNLNTEELMVLCTGFPGLEELNISGMKEAMTDQVVQSLMSSCQRLVSIDLSDSTVIGSTSIEAIIEHNNLKKLALSRCYSIPASSLSSITAVKSLEDLQLFGFIKKNIIADVARSSPNLRINSEIFSSIASPPVKKNRRNFTTQITSILKNDV